MAFTRTTPPKSAVVRPATTGPKPGGRAAPARKARYGGIQAEQEKDPFIGLGTYRLEVLALTEREPINDHQTVALTVKVLDAADGSVDPVDSTRFIAFRVMGSGSDQGRKRMKSFIVGAHGCETAEEYDAIDPEGFLLDAYLGYACPEYPDGATVVGRVVDLECTQGNPIKKEGVLTGEYYTNYKWFAVPEEDQAPEGE
jgi:hypothetical protein